jgi:hypothetical protein
MIVIALIVMESILKLKFCFSCYKKATEGSSFYSLEKQIEMKNLEMNSRKLLRIIMEVV